MSRQVHADPEQLRDFAAHLNGFGAKTSEELASLRAHFDRLDWHDAQRQRFETEVAEIGGKLTTFMNLARDIARLVNLKAEPLEQYHEVS